MVKKYKKSEKIRICGTNDSIVKAIQMLDRIPDLKIEMAGSRLKDEGGLRIQIQDAMENDNISATILIDGNIVYPLSKIIKEFVKLKKLGTLEKMTKNFYYFLSLNFDIAHFSREGYIAFYDNDFEKMYHCVLKDARVPFWWTDLQRILKAINNEQNKTSQDAA